MASIGQARTHLAQPVQASGVVWASKLEVNAPMILNFLRPPRISQQQLQQLQMKVGL